MTTELKVGDIVKIVATQYFCSNCIGVIVNIVNRYSNENSGGVWYSIKFCDEKVQNENIMRTPFDGGCKFIKSELLLISTQTGDLDFLCI